MNFSKWTKYYTDGFESRNRSNTFVHSLQFIVIYKYRTKWAIKLFVSLNLAKIYSYYSEGGKGQLFTLVILHEYSLELQNPNFGGKRLGGVSQKVVWPFFNAVVQKIYPSYC